MYCESTRLFTVQPARYILPVSSLYFSRMVSVSAMSLFRKAGSFGRSWIKTTIAAVFPSLDNRFWTYNGFSTALFFNCFRAWLSSGMVSRNLRIIKSSSPPMVSATLARLLISRMPSIPARSSVIFFNRPRCSSVKRFSFLKAMMKNSSLPNTVFSSL